MTSPGRDVRIVMITNPSKRADAVLAALAERGLTVDAVVLDQGKLGGRQGLQRTRQVLRRSGVRATIRRIVRRVRRAVTGTKRGSTETDRYSGSTAAVHPVDDINSDSSRALLADMKPDLVVLGSSRILRPPVLEIPTLGVLNAHPGLLPAYRGVDVVAWAVLNGDPQGVTVHWVDRGIDTGESVAQESFEVRPGDRLSDLEARADAIAGKLMADVVECIVQERPLEAIDHGDATGALYTRMTPNDRRRVHEILAEASPAGTDGHRD